MRRTLIKEICKPLLNEIELDSLSFACKLIQTELNKHLNFSTNVTISPTNDSISFIGKIFFLDENGIEKCETVTIIKK